MVTLSINGETRKVTSTADTPLLYVLRGELDVMTPKFGCGMAQCGACSVLVDGVETRACITPIASLEGKQVTTVEGLPFRWQQQKGLANDPNRLHPVQQAWIDEQVPQCGFCQNGQISSGALVRRAARRRAQSSAARDPRPKERRASSCANQRT